MPLWRLLALKLIRASNFLAGRWGPLVSSKADWECFAFERLVRLNLRRFAETKETRIKNKGSTLVVVLPSRAPRRRSGSWWSAVDRLGLSAPCDASSDSAGTEIRKSKISHGRPLASILCVTSWWTRISTGSWKGWHATCLRSRFI